MNCLITVNMIQLILVIYILYFIYSLDCISNIIQLTFNLESTCNISSMKRAISLLEEILSQSGNIHTYFQIRSVIILWF